MLSRRIVLGRQLISIAGSCNYHALSTTPVLLKDKSDNRSSGLAAPRKQFVQEQKEKKMKSEEDKERQRAERLEREVCLFFSYPSLCQILSYHTIPITSSYKLLHVCSSPMTCNRNKRRRFVVNS